MGEFCAHQNRLASPGGVAILYGVLGDFRMRIAAILMVVALYVLHQDFWFWRSARPLVFGILPIGLFYHAAYVVASSLVLWVLVTFLWPSHLETTDTKRE